MKRRALVSLGASLLMVGGAFQASAAPRKSRDIPPPVTLVVHFAGLVNGGCNPDGPGECTTSGHSTSCTIVGYSSNPLGVLSCSVDFRFSFPRSCGPTLSTDGSLQISYGGGNIVEPLSVASNQASFHGEGVSGAGDAQVFHTTLHGKHNCVVPAPGAFAGQSIWIVKP